LDSTGTIYGVESPSGGDDVLETRHQVAECFTPDLRETTPENLLAGCERLERGIHQFVDEIRRPNNGDCERRLLDYFAQDLPLPLDFQKEPLALYLGLPPCRDIAKPNQ